MYHVYCNPAVRLRRILLEHGLLLQNLSTATSTTTTTTAGRLQCFHIISGTTAAVRVYSTALRPFQCHHYGTTLLQHYSSVKIRRHWSTTTLTNAVLEHCIYSAITPTASH
eukprot:6407241-Pyramimonas_sp.AAC.1